MRQTFSAVAYLHANRVVHRDLKPENFLLKYDNDDSVVKLIDFGLSKKLQENEILTDPNGTPFYIAPEILEGNYTEAVDNWSLGVILYIMLSGSPPFYGKDNREILRAVEKGVFTLSLKPFLSCSIEVKDLISKLLVKNVSRRFTASQAYNHPWVQQQVDKESKDLVIDVSVIKNIENFLQQKALKKAVMLYVAQMIPEKEVENIRQVFTKMDGDGNGSVSSDEFAKGFKLFRETTKISLDENDLDKLFAAIDTNHDGVIEYTEFLAVFMDNYIFKNERYLRMAFEKFDLDKSGKISKEELIEVLGGGDLVPLTEIDHIMQQADTDGDGEIDYNEILRYIKMSGASVGGAKGELARSDTTSIKK
jgi:calcium-dependent protein kinase